jgi:hypothetical protein
VSGSFDIYVTRQGITQSFTVSVDLTTTWVATEFSGTGWHFNVTTGTLTVSTNAGTTNWRTERGDNFQPANVTTITITNAVTAIGEDAFRGDSAVSIASVTIPASVTSIGANAFTDIPTLTTATFQSTTPPTFGSTVFGGTTPFEYVIVPFNAIETYRQVPQLSGLNISHFGTVPPTGIANITWAMWAMFAFMIAAAVLWGFALRGKLRREIV